MFHRLFSSVESGSIFLRTWSQWCHNVCPKGCHFRIRSYFIRWQSKQCLKFAVYHYQSCFLCAFWDQFTNCCPCVTTVDLKCKVACVYNIMWTFHAVSTDVLFPRIPLDSIINILCHLASFNIIFDVGLLIDKCREEIIKIKPVDSLWRHVQCYQGRVRFYTFTHATCLHHLPAHIKLNVCHIYPYKSMTQH